MSARPSMRGMVIARYGKRLTRVDDVAELQNCSVAELIPITKSFRLI